MGVDSEDTEFLRFNVPIDPRNPDDVKLFEKFNAIPNGLKQAVTRMALLRFLPEDEEQLKLMLAEALLEQSKTGRKRGRRRKSAEPAQAKSKADRKADELQETSAASGAADQVDKETAGSVVAEEKGAAAGEVKEEKGSVATQEKKSDLGKYTGMLGSTNWN